MAEKTKNTDLAYPIEGHGYTGGKMVVWSWAPPVVLDLSGGEVSAQTPLLTDHINSVLARLGLIKPIIGVKELTFSGDIVSNNLRAQEVKTQLDAKKPWQTSVGVRPLLGQSEEIKEGSVEINGRKFSAPFIHVKKWQLKEISVVSLGKDNRTRMVRAGEKIDLEKVGEDYISASAAELEIDHDPFFQDIKAKYDKSYCTIEASKKEAKGEVMLTDLKTKEKEVSEPIDTSLGKDNVNSITAAEKENIKIAERNRIKKYCSQVREICNGEYPEIEAKALEEFPSLDTVRDQVIKAMREGYPKISQKPKEKEGQGNTFSPSPFNLSVYNPPKGEEFKQTIEAAFLLKGNRVTGNMLMKKWNFSEKIVNDADKNYRFSMGDLLLEVAWSEGKTSARHFSGGQRADIIQAAFSTISLPGILNNVASKELQRSYELTPNYADVLTSVGSLADFKQGERYRITDMGELKKVGPTGGIEHSDLSEEKSTIQLETYAKTYGVTRQDWYNDNLGALNKLPRFFGQKASKLKDKLLFTLIMTNGAYQGANLFSATHRNLITGADTKPSFDSLARLDQLFADQTDLSGEPITATPRYYITSTKYKLLGREITGSDYKIPSGGDSQTGIAAVQYPQENVLSKLGLIPLAPPYLSNTNYPNYSDEANYLWGNPEEIDTVELAYLDGKKVPTVEFFTLNPNTLGFLWRVYFDIGVAPMDFRGMCMADGVAP